MTELSLLIALTENVDLAIRGQWRRDGRPPGSVVPDDAVVRIGLALSFRSSGAGALGRTGLKELNLARGDLARGMT